MVPRPAIFDSYVLALDISFLFQPLGERAQTGREGLRRCTAEEADQRHGPLLRVRGEWPRRRCATEKYDQLASLHGRPLSGRLHPTTSLNRAMCFASQQN